MPASRDTLWRRLGWLVLLWAGGVAAVGGFAWLLKQAMRWGGLLP